MSETFLRGELVRLKRPYATALNRTGAGRRGRVDWLKRRGIAHGMTVRGTICTIMWPGCKGVDPVPVGAVERCKP